LGLWDMDLAKNIKNIAGHGTGVSAAAFLPSGKGAVSASYDATLMEWDLTDSSRRQTLSGHLRSIRDAAVTRDGRFALTSSEDVGLLKWWDLMAGKETWSRDGHSSPVMDVDLTADGNRAISGATGAYGALNLKDQGAVLLMWDTATGKQLQNFFGTHKKGVAAAAISPDGTRAVSGGYLDGSLVLWDTATAKPLRSFDGHGETVHAVDFGCGNDVIASASNDATVRLWNTSENAPGSEYTLQPFGDVPTSLEFSPDCSHLAVGTISGVVHILKVR